MTIVRGREREKYYKEEEKRRKSIVFEVLAWKGACVKKATATI
jgi:hypothetical protein